MNSDFWQSRQRGCGTIGRRLKIKSGGATPALLKYLKESLAELNRLRATDLEMEQTEESGDNSK